MSIGTKSKVLLDKACRRWTDTKLAKSGMEPDLSCAVNLFSGTATGALHPALLRAALQAAAVA